MEIYKLEYDIKKVEKRIDELAKNVARVKENVARVKEKTKSVYSIRIYELRTLKNKFAKELKEMVEKVMLNLNLFRSSFFV
jgi:hypothetical protein